MKRKNPNSNLLTKSFNPFEVSGQEADQEIKKYFNKLKRNEIRQIIKSYHQTYDHFHELLQNAVDACEVAYYKYSNITPTPAQQPYEPQIQVYVNVDNNNLSVIDNGIGMTLDEVKKYLFTPYATNKPSLPLRQRGEKGVGNAFLSYGSNGYHFTTRHMDETSFISGRLSSGIVWALGNDGSEVMPLVEPDELHPQFANIVHGTFINIEFSEQTNIRRLKDQGTTLQNWEAILRLHTAVGYISFDEDDEFLNALKVILYVTYNGVTQSKIVQKGYLYPHKVDGLASVRLSDLKRGERGKLPPRHTMKHCIYNFYDNEAVKQKALSKLDSYSRFGPYRNELREDITRFNPSAYIVFTWSSEFWDEANKRIFGHEQRELDHGIVFATKTQRIAEPKKIDFSFRSGDYNRFFIVLNMNKLEADIGRKSLERRVYNIGMLISDSFQNDFVDYQDALTPTPRSRREEEEVTLENLLNSALKSGSDLNFPGVGLSLLKTPREEQDVIALFFNLLGHGFLKGYKFFSTLISQQYDGVGYFDLKKANDILYDQNENPLGIPEENFFGKPYKKSTERNFIEFKMSTDDLIRDIKKGDKQLRDIKWLVCWTKGSLHEREGIAIDEILEQSQRGHR
jgi:hypothetical protein